MGKRLFFIILSLPWTFALLLAAQAVLPKASIDRSNSSSCTLKCPNLTPIFLTPEFATKTTRHICKAWGTHLTVPRLDKVVPLDGLPANHTIEQNQEAQSSRTLGTSCRLPLRYWAPKDLVGLRERFFNLPRETHIKDTIPANAPALGAMIHDGGAPVWRVLRAGQISKKTARRT